MAARHGQGIVSNIRPEGWPREPTAAAASVLLEAGLDTSRLGGAAELLLLLLLLLRQGMVRSSSLGGGPGDGAGALGADGLRSRKISAWADLMRCALDSAPHARGGQRGGSMLRRSAGTPTGGS